MDMFSLSGKTVVLTGGCGNLGQTMAAGLLNYGANVVIADLEDRMGSDFDKEKAAGRLIVISCNLAETASIQEMYQKAVTCYGKIDILINNAAYGGGAGGKKCAVNLDDMTDEMWETGIDGTASVTFRCIREALPFFDRQKKGTIVNIASMYGIVAPDFTIYGDSGNNSPPTYGAGKAAVVQLTRYCASALASRGVRVNSITPGPFPKITAAMDPDFLKKLQDKTMLKRTGNPEELLGALILLSSDASSFMTGTNIVVDGGWTAM